MTPDKSLPYTIVRSSEGKNTTESPTTNSTMAAAGKEPTSTPHAAGRDQRSRLTSESEATSTLRHTHNTDQENRTGTTPMT